MIRNARLFRPRADALETRALLSTAAATARPAIAGRATGSYFAPEDNRAADAPLAVRVDATGSIRRFGAATLVADLSVGGFKPVGSPSATGRLVLANARGRVVLRLLASQPATVPDGRVAMSVMAARGSGAYKGFRAAGNVTFDFGPNQIQSIAYPSPVGGDAIVTLRLDRGRPPALMILKRS